MQCACSKCVAISKACSLRHPTICLLLNFNSNTLQHTVATHCRNTLPLNFKSPHATQFQHAHKPTTHYNTLLPHTAATHCCNTLPLNFKSPHTTQFQHAQKPSTHCCITLLHHTAATHCCNTLPISFSSHNYIELLDVEWQCVAAMCCSVLQ